MELNVLGTRLRDIDGVARELIADALNAGRAACAHLAITPNGLDAMSRAVTARIELQIVTSAWASHQIYTLADMGTVRAVPRVVIDRQTGRVQAINVEIWLSDPSRSCRDIGTAEIVTCDEPILN